MNAKKQSPHKSPSRVVRYFQGHLRDCLATMGDLWRAPLSSFMTIAVVGIALTLPVTFLVLLSHGEELVHSLKNQAQITLLLKSEVSSEQRTVLATTLKSRPDISELQIISPSEALKELDLALNVQDALKTLPDNPLPWSLVLILHPSETPVEMLLQDLQRLPEVEMASLDLQWVKRLAAVMEVAKHLVIGLAALLSVAALLVIGNTLRINIENRRDHIEVAKLLGATDAFVRRPFLYFGMWYGWLGAILAILICLLFVQWLSSVAAHLFALYENPMVLRGLDLQSILWLLMLGTLLGFGGAWFAVSRHLRQLTP